MELTRDSSGIRETVGSTFLYHLKMIDTSTFQEKGKGSSRVLTLEFRLSSLEPTSVIVVAGQLQCDRWLQLSDLGPLILYAELV